MHTDACFDVAPDQLDWPFRRAVLLLVESECYLHYQSRLARVAPGQQPAFLALLRGGTPLADCFGELACFEAWQLATLPQLAQQGIEPGATAQQVAMYLLGQQRPVVW